jgi:CTP-dependent riboflavin kinase
MADWRDEITGYGVPEDAILIEDGPFAGFHWVRLRSAEDLAMAVYRIPAFDLARVVKAGGIADGLGDQAAYVGLFDHRGTQHLIGFCFNGTLNYPASKDRREDAASIRDAYAEAIYALEHNAAELFERKAENVSLRP